MATSFGFDKRDNAPYGASLEKRTPAAKSTFCRITVFHYEHQYFGSPSGLSDNQISDENFLKVKRFDINYGIESVDVSKALAQPSATFEVSLLPSQNWKALISPGDWVAIYMYSEYHDGGFDKNDTKNLVLLGNVDRISRNAFRDEQSDELTMRYQISGRNFGKVLETIDVWYDPYTKQQKTQDVALIGEGLILDGSPYDLVTAYLDVFVGGGHTFAQGKTKDLNQWQIPSAIGSMFGASKNKFDGILNRNVDVVPGYKIRSSISIESNGSVWEMLQQNANIMINELFVEEVRNANGTVQPTIVLRSRPVQTPFFKDHMEKDDVSGELKSSYSSLIDFAKTDYVEISPGEILYENLGRDDDGRINMVWLNTRQEIGYFKSSMANLNSDGTISNPLFNLQSIQRSGLRRFQSLLEFVQPAGVSQNQVETNLFKAFLMQLYDQNYSNHMYETGTIETTGVLEAELGKALIIKSKGATDKVFYIEGYTHSWKFPSTWRTVFNVTHGQFADPSKPFIDAADHDYGQPDVDSEDVYGAKTVVVNDRNNPKQV